MEFGKNEKKLKLGKLRPWYFFETANYYIA